jgi:hypothetical protein
MSSAFPQFNPARLRSYVLRIPVCTRLLIAVILLFWIGSISLGFGAWARLEPKLVFAGGGEFIFTSWTMGMVDEQRLRRIKLIWTLSQHID